MIKDLLFIFGFVTTHRNVVHRVTVSVCVCGCTVGE